MKFVTLTGFLIPALAGAGESSLFLSRDRTVWQPQFSAGLDAYLHTYSLASSDTTESLAEAMMSAALSGQSSRRARHRWRLRGEASVGTELFRENLEAQYRWQPTGAQARLRLDGQLRGRQYRKETEYTLNSDHLEGRLDLRAYPGVWPQRQLELRGWGSFTDYQTPSTLEVDHHETGGGLFLQSRGLDGPIWSLGTRYAFRAYPDTSGIDRRTLGLEGTLDTQDLDGQELRVYHKSERRHIRDTSARPSAWSHWTDASGKVTAGPGWVFLDLQTEIWQYDQNLAAYYDSWRVKGVAGYTWGDLFSTTWQIGLAAEKLAADEGPESYSELGLRAGVDAFAGRVSGSLTLEVGRRQYRDGTITLEIPDASGTVLESEDLALYSDFTYWEIWLTASWRLTEQLSLDVLASYEPESHTEQDDDAALGFGTLKLVYRP